MRFLEYKKPFIAGLIFSATVIGVSLTYGAFNYIISVNTASSGSTLTSTEWNKVVSNLSALDSQLATVTSTTVPIGAVMAFNLTTCPGGWNPADGASGRPDLRGQFVRWLNTFDGGSTTRSDGSQDPDCSLRNGWCALRSTQSDGLGSHSHSILVTGYNTTIKLWNGGSDGASLSFNDSFNDGTSSALVYAANTGGNETRPKNVAFIYCIKS